MVDQVRLVKRLAAVSAKTLSATLATGQEIFTQYKEKLMGPLATRSDLRTD